MAANKVPLAAVAHAGGAAEAAWLGLSREPAVAAALGRETERKATLLQAYARAASALGAAGIRPVLFKSPRGFPHLSSNLDVLVPPESFEESRRIIRRLGHIQLPHYREDHKVLFRTFDGGEPSLSVHLHEAVSWGRVVILEGDGVVGRSVPGEEPGIFVSSPQDCLAATVAHTILETDQVRLSDLRTARFCLDRGASVAGLLQGARDARWLPGAASGLLIYDSVCETATGAPMLDSAERELARAALDEHIWARRLHGRVLRQGCAALPFQLPRHFAKLHLLRLILRDDRRDPERRFLDLAASGWNLLANRLRVRTCPASLITVSGPDGAGKSDVAESVAGALRLCELPTRRIWSRGGFSRLGVAGKAAARRVMPSAVPAPQSESAKRTFLQSSWRRALWSWAVAAEQALAVQWIRLLILLGRTVVCDRYVYDSLADLAARSAPSRAGPLPTRASGFLLAAAPVPDLALFLDVRPEVAHDRKSDGTSLESRRDLAAAYGAVARLAPLARLDAELPRHQVAQEAVVRALRICFSRLERRGA
jgi:thymidylate kinase